MAIEAAGFGTGRITLAALRHHLSTVPNGAFGATNNIPSLDLNGFAEPDKPINTRKERISMAALRDFISSNPQFISAQIPATTNHEAPSDEDSLNMPAALAAAAVAPPAAPDNVNETGSNESSAQESVPTSDATESATTSDDDESHAKRQRV